MRPHRSQPTRLPHPWDSPGKNTGVGCHFLLQCMKVKSETVQSCPTLCDPIDSSPPGSSVPGILKARILEWVAISFSDVLKAVSLKEEISQSVQSLSRVRFFATLWTITRQAPLSMGFFRQEYWSGLPFPSPEDLPAPMFPVSPALQADS